MGIGQVLFLTFQLVRRGCGQKGVVLFVMSFHMSGLRVCHKARNAI